MDVFMNGTRLIPENASSSRINITITAHNRPEVLECAIEQYMKHLPSDALVVMIDDGSSPATVIPANVKLVRHDQSLSIVASENASLIALVDAGCEYLFLWDDDAWPIDDNWYLPYIESSESRLACQFLDLAGPRKTNDMTVLYRDDRHIAYTGRRGVILCYCHSAIDKVGGFDLIHRRGMYEHPDLALRIHNAGLSAQASADVTGFEELIHSMDKYEEGARSIPRPERGVLTKTNIVIYSDRRDSGYTAYVSFRKQHNVVITTLLTSQNNPQCQVRMRASSELVQGWAISIRGADAVVLADKLDTAPKDVNLFKVLPLSMSSCFV